ncbi:MAG TPA: flagellar motor switch protein FliG [Acidimicrobiales bacterium]|nr:flagellar motor switch protein FliG [Acidimicrobiales bacterium]
MSPAAVHQMSGARKAALLLISLGTDRAARIIKSLNEDEVEVVMSEIANIGLVDEPIVNEVIKEFVSKAQRQVRVPQGGVEVAKGLLSEALGNVAKAEAMMSKISGPPIGTYFRALTALDSSVAASILAREHPQTIALVLSRLPAERGLAMLRDLPESLRGEVAYRIATLSPPTPETIKAVESGLESRILSAATGQRLRVDTDPVKPLVEILARADAETERTIMARIDEVDEKLAQEIRQRLFTIEDLLKLEDKALQLLLRQVDTRELAMAMKGTSDVLRERIFSNLSERATENLREEMDLLGPQRLTDVEKSRKEIVRTVRQLEQEGSIVLSRETDDYIE